jgi:hypothetical protein
VQLDEKAGLAARLRQELEAARWGLF